MMDHTQPKPVSDPPRQTYDVQVNSPAPQFTAVDTVFAWLCFLFGYLYCRAMPVTEYPLGGFLFVVVLYIATFCVLSIKKVRLTPRFVLTGISALVLCTALILSENRFLSKLSFTYAIASYFYFLYIAFGNGLENGISDLIWLDYIKAMFVMPFGSLTAIFKANRHEWSAKGLSVLAKILLGPAIAFIPTVLILVLLSYDEGFSDLMNKILDFDLDNVFSHIGSLIMAIPLAMYSFGLYHASCNHKKREVMTAQGCRNGLRKVRILPAITAISGAVPIYFLYGVYFISQWEYYVSGFTGVLPENFSYAEYARSGFFELCSVSVINLLLILFIRLLIKRNKNDVSHALRILTCIFCACTLILISTAVAKLCMYIDYYGLTQKRIYAMWLMGLIAIVYLIIAVLQFIPKAKIVAVSLSVCVVLFGALCLCNVNQVVVRYNLDRYLDGTLETVDVRLLQELGDSAIPEVVRCIQIMEEEKRTDTAAYRDLKEYLEGEVLWMQQREVSVFSWNIPYYNARKALIEQGLMEKNTGQ